MCMHTLYVYAYVIRVCIRYTCMHTLHIYVYVIRVCIRYTFQACMHALVPALQMVDKGLYILYVYA
jgi:hypothetical protein